MAERIHLLIDNGYKEPPMAPCQTQESCIENLTRRERQGAVKPNAFHDKTRKLPSQTTPRKPGKATALCDVTALAGLCEDSIKCKHSSNHGVVRDNATHFPCLLTQKSIFSVFFCHCYVNFDFKMLTFLCRSEHPLTRHM